MVGASQRSGEREPGASARARLQAVNPCRPARRTRRVFRVGAVGGADVPIVRMYPESDVHGRPQEGAQREEPSGGAVGRIMESL